MGGRSGRAGGLLSAAQRLRKAANGVVDIVVKQADVSAPKKAADQLYAALNHAFAEAARSKELEVKVRALDEENAALKKQLVLTQRAGEMARERGRVTRALAQEADDLATSNQLLIGPPAFITPGLHHAVAQSRNSATEVPTRVARSRC